MPRQVLALRSPPSSVFGNEPQIRGFA